MSNNQLSTRETILNKFKELPQNVERADRLNAIYEIRRLLEKLEAEDTIVSDIIDLTDEEAEKQFQDLKESIHQSNPNNRSLEFLISGLIHALDQVDSFKVRQLIYHYTQQLAFKWNRLTGKFYFRKN